MRGLLRTMYGYLSGEEDKLPFAFGWILILLHARRGAMGSARENHVSFVDHWRCSK